MFDFEEYRKKTIQFVNSLVVKLDEISVHQNYHLYVKNAITPPDKKQSKYYLNLVGILGPTDQEAFIQLSENTEPVIFNREFLYDNPDIHKELLKFDTAFNNLIKDNPGLTDYIKATIYDIQLDNSLGIENYAIVAYMDGYLEDNEYSVLSELESFIKHFMLNLNNNKYIIDELFLPALLSSLYSSLVIKLLNLKIKNILTNKVDIFHMSNYMQSYKNLYGYLDLFNVKTNMWLYGNIARLSKNIGKNETLESLLKDVYNENFYGVGKIMYNKRKPTLILDDYYNVALPYFNYDVDFNISNANEAMYNITDRTFTLDIIATILKDNNKTPEFKTYEIGNIERILNTSKTNYSLTKLFVLDNPERIKKYYNNNLTLTLSNYINIIEDKNINFTIDYINPFTSKLYKIPIKDLLYITVYNIYRSFDITSSEVIINGSGILDLTHNKTDILNLTYYKDKLDKIYDYIVNDVNNITITEFTIQEYMYTLRTIEAKTWYLISNISDPTLKADIRVIINALLVEKTYTFDIVSIEKLIADNAYEYLIIGDSLDIIEDVLKKVTGIVIDEFNIVYDKYVKLSKFFDKITSYTIDLVSDLNIDDITIIQTLKPDAANNYRPYLEVKDAYYTLYEEANTIIKDSGFNDSRLSIVNNYMVDIASMENSKGSIFIQHDDIVDKPYIYSYAKHMLEQFKPSMKTNITEDRELKHTDNNKVDTDVIKNLEIYHMLSSPIILALPVFSRSVTGRVYNYNTRFDGYSNKYEAIRIVDEFDNVTVDETASSDIFSLLNDITVNPFINITGVGYTELKGTDSNATIVNDVTTTNVSVDDTSLTTDAVVGITDIAIEVETVNQDIYITDESI